MDKNLKIEDLAPAVVCMLWNGIFGYLPVFIVLCLLMLCGFNVDIISYFLAPISAFVGVWFRVGQKVYDFPKKLGIKFDFKD